MIPISGAEEFARELLRAAKAKARAIAQARASRPPVITLADFAANEPPKGLIDDSAAVIEVALKHCLACNFMQQGDTRERQVIEGEIKRLGHDASKIFQRLSAPAREEIRNIYTECNREYSNFASIFGKMAGFEEMLAWVQDGPNYRYNAVLPEPCVPIGWRWSPPGTSNVEQLPSFPQALADWASEEFMRAKPARSRREALSAELDLQRRHHALDTKRGEEGRPQQSGSRPRRWLIAAVDLLEPPP